MHWAFQWCKFHANELNITMKKTDPCSEATKICRLNLYPHTVCNKCNAYKPNFLQRIINSIISGHSLKVQPKSASLLSDRDERNQIYSFKKTSISC